ncbi:hypothetical protein SAMN05216339_102293 [Nitrosomonas eutropha]|uniref:Uncharacterized protein n=1 Tax=Nitrosomonas eutropha TaxID=916 RepID=A0A1I7G942_9PROT|nr:hypothetical protein SAMN05216339_102293 [Nitrosomonas eutropha]
MKLLWNKSFLLRSIPAEEKLEGIVYRHNQHSGEIPYYVVVKKLVYNNGGEMHSQCGA